MGLFGFIANIGKATLDTAKLPVSMTKDIIDVFIDGEVQHTANNANEIVDDLTNAIDDLLDD